MRASLMIAGILLASAAHAQDKPVLNVYTYDSFVSDWGPGPVVEAAFEETCGCDLQFTSAGDGAALLARVQLEGRIDRRGRRSGAGRQPDRGGDGYRAVRRSRAGRYRL